MTTKRGRTVARLIPAGGPHALKGKLAGVAMTTARDEDLFATGARWKSGARTGTFAQ